LSPLDNEVADAEGSTTKRDRAFAGTVAYEKS
jgi:hypothetical protein